MPSIEYSSSYSVSYWGSVSASVRLEFSESYNVNTNQTTLSLTGLAFKKGDSTNVGSVPVYGSVSVDGQTICTIDNTGGGKMASVSLSGSGWCYASLSNVTRNSATVTHNADGTKNVSVTVTAGNLSRFCCVYSWYHTIGNNKHALTSVPFGVPTQSGTMALTTRPRASSISSCPASVNTTETFSLSVARNSSAFYHKATITCGGTTLHTSSAFATSMSVEVPRSWLSNWTTVAAVTATVSVQTYTNSSCTTAVGSAVTRTFTINADADMKPSVSAGWATLAAYNTGTPVASAGSPISGYYVKGYSKAQATFDSNYIDLSDTASATIASYSITCNGETVSASPYLTPVLESTSVAVTCTVTDSRGRTASETFTVSVYDYAPPAISNVEVFRCDDQGVADDDGAYYSAKATLAYAPLNNQNVCPMYTKFKAAGGSYGSATSMTSGTASIVGTLSADITYTVMVYATDSLGNTAEYYATVPTRKWVMHFRPHGNGAAFGKAAETDNLFEVTPDWDVQIGGDLTVLGTINGGGGGGGGAMYFPSQTVNVATNAEIFRITSAAITTQTVLVECTFANPSYITSDVTWTSYDGYIAFYGTCTAATTADVTLSNVETPSPQTPLAIANGGTGASTAAGALTNLGLATALKYIGTNPSGYNINTASNASGYGWMNYGQVSGDFPNNVGYGMLVHLKGDNDSAIQLYINDSHFCARQYANSSWSAWRIL